MVSQKAFNSTTTVLISLFIISSLIYRTLQKPNKVWRLIKGISYGLHLIVNFGIGFD